MLCSCNNTEPNSETEKPEDNIMEFYVGTYTDGDSEGIYKYSINNEGSLDSVGLMAKTSNPSYMTITSDKKYLLTINENNTSTIESYKIDEDKLTLISKKDTKGSASCFINVNKKGDVLVANYSSGDDSFFRIKSNGFLSELQSLTKHKVETKEAVSHAHSVWFIPNTSKIVSVDLGTDELIFSELSNKSDLLKPVIKYTVNMVKGSGPRHLSFHKKGWIYTANELSSTVSLLKKDKNGIYKYIESTSTLPDNFKGKSYCGDIHISTDNKFLYVSNRGHNSITVFSINQENGKLKPLSFEPVKGTWPRNFTISPDGNFLLVANQKTDNIVAFRIDKNNGLLEFVSEIKAPKPVCLLF